MRKYKGRNWDERIAPEEWMARAWSECEMALVVTRGPSLETLPPHLRAIVPSARCLETIAGYMTYAIVGRRAGIIGDGDFDLMMEQVVATAWDSRQIESEKGAA